MIWVWVIVGLVALQRLAELPYAERNTKALLARGAVEVGREHYIYIVILHAAWLIAIFLAIPSPPMVHIVPLVLYVLLQGLRVWTLVSLGGYWTTRIITLPGAPLVKRGPYRYVSHPNYIIVAGEIVLLPLVFGEWIVAMVFTVLNGIAMVIRIREEERALSARRAITVQ